MALKDNHTDAGTMKLFCVLMGAVSTILGVIVCYCSVFCYHQRNRGRDGWKSACCF